MIKTTTSRKNNDFSSRLTTFLRALNLLESVSRIQEGMYPRVKAASKASSEKLRLTLSKYYPESTSTTLITSLKEDEKVSVQLYAGNKLPMSILNWIFELFELNMKEMLVFSPLHCLFTVPF